MSTTGTANCSTSGRRPILPGTGSSIFFVVSFLNSLLSLFGGGVIASLIEALDYWLHEVKHILNLLTSLQGASDPQGR